MPVVLAILLSLSSDKLDAIQGELNRTLAASVTKFPFWSIIDTLSAALWPASRLLRLVEIVPALKLPPDSAPKRYSVVPVVWPEPPVPDEPPPGVRLGPPSLPPPQAAKIAAVDASRLARNKNFITSSSVLYYRVLFIGEVSLLHCLGNCMSLISLSQ